MHDVSQQAKKKLLFEEVLDGMLESNVSRLEKSSTVGRYENDKDRAARRHRNIRVYGTRHTVTAPSPSGFRSAH